MKSFEFSGSAMIFAPGYRRALRRVMSASYRLTVCWPPQCCRPRSARKSHGRTIAVPYLYRVGGPDTAFVEIMKLPASPDCAFPPRGLRVPLASLLRVGRDTAKWSMTGHVSQWVALELAPRSPIPCSGNQGRKRDARCFSDPLICGANRLTNSFSDSRRRRRSTERLQSPK